MAVSTFPCTHCGAELEFKPGTRQLTCPYCAGVNDIPAPPGEVKELDLNRILADLSDKAEMQDAIVVHCSSCGADCQMAPNTTSQSCPFCGSHIVATGTSQRHIKPQAVLPFKVDRKVAKDKFREWISSRWFAPGDLKRQAAVESDATYSSRTGLVGLYLPYWTFDARATTSYNGQRGDNYTVTTGSGKNRRTTTRIRWRWVSGVVENAFDDVLVAGSVSLPPERLRDLGAWDLPLLEPYQDAFLSGYRAESYTIDLPQAFATGKEIMREEIERTIRADIGGDHQRIATMHPDLHALTFKHILLPIWVSAYRYNGKVYRFLVNGRTGQISGERPYSAWKIALTVLAGLIVALVIGYLVSRK
jgi:DNA-directed RNA polymerase subunit RPC12/RpoP